MSSARWSDPLRHPLVYAEAVLAVTAAALRLARIEPRLAFDATVARLRDRPAWRPRCATPGALARVAGRLLPLLPPHRMGRCMKRSLVLLDLWTACGLAPRLHLGLRGTRAGGREGHAWLTVDDPELALLAGDPRGSVEAAEL